MQRKTRGFTLVELMITLLVAAIGLTLGIPSYQNFIEKSRVRSTTEELVDLLRMSRLIAVEHRNKVSVCGSSSNRECDNNWTSGILSVKRGQDGAADEIMGSITISEKVSLSKTNDGENNPNIDFQVSGWVPWDNTTFSICPTNGQQRNAYKVVVAPSGKIRVEPNTNNEDWC